MIAWSHDLLIATIAALVVAAGGLATSRDAPRERVARVGLVVGLVTAVAGVVALGQHDGSPADGWPIADAISLPFVPLAGLGLIATFLGLPRRDLDRRASAALLVATAAHLALVASPPGPIAAFWWAIGCAATASALPSGPTIRLALPYLGLAALLGAVGIVVGGPIGAGLALVAVALRLGVPPFHSWSVGAYTLGSPSVAAAVIAPLHGIGLLARAPLGFGDAAVPITVALVLAAALASALALVQAKLARAVGFLTSGISSVVLIGLVDADVVGHIGGLMMCWTASTALLGLGLVAGAVRARRGAVPITRYLGLARYTPTFALLFLVFGLAAAGAPGTAAFVTEDLVLHGGIGEHPLLLLACVAAVSLKGYVVFHLFARVFLGPPEAPPLPDALRRERIGLWAAAGLLIATGLVPQVLAVGWNAPAERVAATAP